MLIYLKRQNIGYHDPINRRGRLINIFLCSCKGITPLLSLFALYINITQEEKLGMIVKNYVTIALISSIDNLFAKTLPDSVHQNAKKLNETGALKINRDSNDY